jgi:hypothetical protein
MEVKGSFETLETINQARQQASVTGMRTLDVRQVQCCNISVSAHAKKIYNSGACRVYAFRKNTPPQVMRRGDMVSNPSEPKGKPPQTKLLIQKLLFKK